jgi:hypothetical protein
MPKVAIGDPDQLRVLQKLDDDENRLPSPYSKLKGGRWVNVCARCETPLGPPPWRCETCAWTPADGGVGIIEHLWPLQMVAEYPVSPQREADILAARAKPFEQRTAQEHMLAQISLAEVEATHMLSTFISFGGPDEPFARRLHQALENVGVKTFFFPEHAKPGEKLHRMMRTGINDYNRVILVCSEASLDRPGVLNELEETLQREARDGGASCLIPVMIDDYVLTRWNPKQSDVAQAVRDRVVADFRGTMSDPFAFDKALQRLLAVLREP